MSEKRKPEVVLIAIVRGKRTRVELFRAELWPRLFGCRRRNRYRVRIGGRWKHGETAWTITQVLAQLRSWISAESKQPGRRF